MKEQNILNLSAIVDFLKNNDDPEYKTTTEIADDIYGVVNTGLKIADVFTGGFYSAFVDKFNPSKHIAKLPDRFNYMNGSREKIALHNYKKYDTANFMIIWASIAYILKDEGEKIDHEDSDLKDFQTLLEAPAFHDSERYIETIMPLLATDENIVEKVKKAYRANTASLKEQFKKYEIFCDTEHQAFVHRKLQKESLTESKLHPNLTPKSIWKTGKKFIGRESELKEVEEKLSQNNSLLLINGIGGVGKSAIASEYLLRHYREYDYYGFITALDDVKSNMVTALEELALRGQNIDEKFDDAIKKLQQLDGKKLLVFDDMKNVEEQEEAIKAIQGLVDWKLLFTSREKIEDIEPYELDRLSQEDARELFIQLSEIDDLEKVDKVLEYLDRHTLFVELTAKSLKVSRDIDTLLEMFKSGKLPQVRVNRKTSFEDYLQQRFTLDGLDDEQKLLLKKFSLMPSIEIPYEDLKSFFEIDDLDWLLSELQEKGWLSGDNESFKMHQIIKEFILNFHTPTFEEIEDIVNYCNTLLKDSANPQTAVEQKENTIYFDSITKALLQIGIENESIALLFLNIANIYHSLGEYEKALPLYEKALAISKKVLGEEHPDTATSYNNLAGLYELMGEYVKALPLYEKALGIYEKVLGEEHPTTGTSYNNLAVFYYSTEEYEKSYDYMKKAVGIRQKVLPPSHPYLVGSQKGLKTIEEKLNS